MKRPKTYAEVREWLEKELRRPVSDSLWSYLDESGYIYPIVTDLEPEGPDDLLRAARKLSDLIRGGQAGRKKHPYRKLEDQFSIPEAERLRAQVTSNFIGRLAANTPEVCCFWKDYLGEKRLTKKQAGILLDSEAPRLYNLLFFKKHKIPLSGHESWFVYYKNGQYSPMYTRNNSFLEIEWKGNDLKLPYTVEQWLRLGDKQSPKLSILGNRFTPLPSKRGFHRGNSTSVVPGSVFAVLRETSIKLTETFGWREEEATWYILTEEPPQSSPIEIEPVGIWRQDHRRLRLRITVESWVSPKTLMNAYRYLQQQSNDCQSHLFSIRNLTLVDEVSELRHRNDPTPSWRELMHLWNKAHPDLAYIHRQCFHRDFKRTVEKLIMPKYFWPWFDPKKKTKSKKEH
ncbi:MAG: hypothetical protein KJ970_13835 [Candidatus Eisenbacteria bacterium]|uniref:Uncharacterized protein n=1 Tax=Eiseniibacteriota bacterium TaxID=2212470 RepID=A0A948RXX6_UNCEI|nr:hypothetical protein [Candidatus Eisenbacteria bacterium]MBU1950041.1 hypothetical protein [Candidatus Eisenbacteria bacterium]MBU2691996.1 hypothetical protein [Candidatus Eisenbacteria bacterium]